MLSKEAGGVVGAKPPAHSLLLHGFECVLHPRASEQASAHKVSDEHTVWRSETGDFLQDTVHSGFIEVVEEPFNEPHRCLVGREPGIDSKTGPVLIQISADRDSFAFCRKTLALQDLSFEGQQLRVIQFVKRRAVRPGQSIHPRIHAGGGQHNLANAVRSTILADVVEEPNADTNVIGGVLVSRIVFFGQLERSPTLLSRESGSKNKCWNADG